MKQSAPPPPLPHHLQVVAVTNLHPKLKRNEKQCITLANTPHRCYFNESKILQTYWTYSVTFATDIERGNVTFKDLSNRESGSRFPMKNCSLRSRFFFFFNNCSTIFHWETAPRFAVRKIFERDIATFNVAGKSNRVGLICNRPIAEADTDSLKIQQLNSVRINMRQVAIIKIWNPETDKRKVPKLFCRNYFWKLFRK